MSGLLIYSGCIAAFTPARRIIAPSCRDVTLRPRRFVSSAASRSNASAVALSSMNMRHIGFRAAHDARSAAERARATEKFHDGGIGPSRISCCHGFSVCPARTSDIIVVVVPGPDPAAVRAAPWPCRGFCVLRCSGPIAYVR